MMCRKKSILTNKSYILNMPFTKTIPTLYVVVNVPYALNLKTMNTEMDLEAEL